MKGAARFIRAEWLNAVGWYDEQNGGGHRGFAFYLVCWSIVVGMLIAVPLIKGFGAWGIGLAAMGAPVGLALILSLFLLLEKTEAHLRARTASERRREL